MRIAVLGSGAMGNVLSQMISAKDGRELAGMVEPLCGQTLDMLGGADAVIDFSHPDNLQMLTDYCRNHRCPAVIATTGFKEHHLEDIRFLSEEVPVVLSANYSLGVSIMKRIIEEVTPVLEDAFDIEIIEKHHNNKLDSPSGTAGMLLAAADRDCRYNHVFGRAGNSKRGREIGVHSIRGGTIAGEHSVIYAGEDEILEFKHTAGSKKIFAAGALRAVDFAVSADPGLYNMEDILF